MHKILLNFRQRSIDSEKITPPAVIEQAKLIEVEKAETGSVRVLINYKNIFNVSLSIILIVGEMGSVCTLS